MGRLFHTHFLEARSKKKPQTDCYYRSGEIPFLSSDHLVPCSTKAN